EDFRIRGSFDANPANLLQAGQDPPYANVIQASGHGMRRLNLPLGILQKTGFVALSAPWAAHVPSETGSVLTSVESQAAGFDADEFHLRVVEKTGEDA